MSVGDGPPSAPIREPREIELFRARIERATAHLAAFGRVWASHLEAHPRHVEVEVNDEGFGLMRIVEGREIPLELSLLLGEFLYELRAALDNCLYAVAILESQERPPPNGDRLEWPICLDETSWREFARRRLEALSPEVRDALAAIQPFMAEAPAWNCLRILHDLARVDRHRTAHLTALYLASVRGSVDTDHITDLDVRVGVVPANRIVATFRKRSPGPLRPEHLDLTFNLEVEMAEIEPSPHPLTEVPQRPWGPLDQRMRALLRAVVEYTEDLLVIAQANSEGSSPG